MSTSPLTTSIAPLSKLTAKVLGIALNNRPDDGLQALSEILGVLCGMAQTIESDWCRSELAHITDDNDIGEFLHCINSLASDTDCLQLLTQEISPSRYGTH